MKRILLLLCLLIFTLPALPQSLGGYPLVDWLVTATHPSNCNATYVTGPPDNRTWVNSNPYTMTGTFGQSHTNTSGYDLLLESSFHGLDLEVRLVLAGGQLSAPHTAGFADWTYVNHALWQMLLPNCFPNMLNGPRNILPLDFETHFGLAPGQTVTGIQINFFAFGGPDFAGAYIIDDIPCPPVNLGPDVTLCAGQSTPLQATTTGATYLWQDGSTDSVIIATQTGTYWVTVNSFCGISTDTIEVNPGAAPAVNLGPDTTLCPGQPLDLSAGVAGAVYQWSTGQTSALISVSQAGSYWVAVTDNCGTGTDTVLVNPGILPSAYLGPDTTICQGQILTLSAGAGNATYQWSTNQSGENITVSQPGTYWVAVGNNCGIASDTITVNQQTVPVAYLGADSSICANQSITLNAFLQDATYLWSDNSTGPEITVSEAGIYWVQLSNQCGNSRDTVQISTIIPPAIELGQTISLCEGQQQTLTANAQEASYLWHTNSTASEHTITTAETIWVIVSNRCGTATDTVTAVYYPAPDISLGPDTVICPGQGITLNATAPHATYLWHDNSTGATLLVTQPGVYSVEVTAHNCTATDSVIIMQHCEVSLSMPNIFTPNGDGINDFLAPADLGGIASGTLTVYNRWGKQVFETSNLETGWSGKDCPEGVYFWSLELTTSTSQPQVAKGWVTLQK